MRFIAASLTLLIFAMLPRLAVGQTPGSAQPAATRERIRELENQIALDQSRAAQAVEKEQTLLDSLDAVSREIAQRSELAQFYRLRLREISLETDSLRSLLRLLHADVAQSKAQYRVRAVHAYKYGRMRDLALILASSSINQMLVRARYLNRFGAQREHRLRHVVLTSRALEQREQELVSSGGETRQLLAKVESEEQSLLQLQREHSKLVVRLRAEREEIERELRRKQNQFEALATLVRGIAEPVTPSAERSQKDNSPPAYGLSGSFSANRGRLAWPASGVVQEPFGERRHPVLGTTTTSPGIVIATAPAADVRAVFDGEVLHVDVMPDFGSVVTIDHGEFKSVFANFSTVKVEVGDRVIAGQVLGQAGTDRQPKGAGVFFALFQQGTPVDPLLWLLQR